MNPDKMMSNDIWTHWRHVEDKLMSTWQTFRFCGVFSEERMERMTLKFGMVMYPDHLQNWLDFGHGLYDFTHFGGVLTWWNRSDLGFGRNGWKFGMRMFPDHLQNWLGFGNGLLILFILVAFWFSGTGQLRSFREFSGNAWEEWPGIWHTGVC